MSNLPKNDPTEGEGVYESQFLSPNFSACLTIGIEYQLLRTLGLSVKNLPA